MKRLTDNELEIRLNYLEEDCADQPRLRRYWGEEFANAKRNFLIAENNLKLIKADLSKAFRMDARVNQGQKVTEGSVEDYYITHEQYQAAKKDEIQAEYEMELIKQYIMSLEDRKEQLGNETKLAGQSFWSKPHTRATPAPTFAQRVEEQKAMVPEGSTIRPTTSTPNRKLPQGGSVGKPPPPKK